MLSERTYAGEFLLSEGDGTISRDTVTIAESQTLKAGHPLGRLATAAAVVAAAAAGNTGNGILTVADPAFGGTVKVGVYRVVCIEPAANGGVFQVEDPDGVVAGIARVGVAYDGPVKFTIADGAADFVAGDAFNVTVKNVVAQHKALAPAATDGTQFLSAFLLDAVTTGVGETAKAAAITRLAEVKESVIPWGAFTDDQKAAAKAQAKGLGIVVR